MNFHQLYHLWRIAIGIVIIMAGDCNIILFDTLMSHSLYPQISFPTRFTRINGTLIDNLFCKLNKNILESIAGISTNNFLRSSTLFFNCIHYYQIELPLKCIQTNTQSVEAMQKVNIVSYNFYNKLHNDQNEDPNLNYNMTLKISTWQLKQLNLINTNIRGQPWPSG